MDTKSVKRWIKPIAFLLVALLASCEDNGVDPLPPDPSGNIVTILNSGFAIIAERQAALSTVGLSVRGTIRYVTHAYPIDIVSYTLQYEYLATEVNLAATTLPQYRPQVLDIRDDIQNFVPLALKPLKEVRIKFHSRIDGKDSLFTIRVAVQAQCGVQEGCEPGLTKLYSGPDLTTGSTLWARNSQSFYFHVRRDYNEEICQYMLADGSTKELTSRNRSLAACDESPDGKFLLVSDFDGKPSNLYLLDLQTLGLKVVIPARDSALVTSAKFSPDGTKIAFMSQRVVSGSYRTSLRIFNRADSSFTVLFPDAMWDDPRLTDWNANNELVYHSFGADLNLLSSTTLIPQRLGYSYRFSPTQLLSDHATVAGNLFIDTQSSEVVETHLALFDVSGKPLRQLTFAAEVIFDYAVSPDRSKVEFTTYRDNHQSLQLYMLSITGARAGKKMGILTKGPNID